MMLLRLFALFNLLFLDFAFGIEIGSVRLDQRQPKRFILSIGIGKFLDSRWQDLRYAEKDAKDMIAALQTTDSHTIHLKAENATLTKIIQALDKIDHLSQSTEDQIIVYLSTHGTLDYKNHKELQRFAVVYDTDTDNLQTTALPIAYLENRLSRYTSTRKALILAFCHSGSGKSALPLPINVELANLKSAFFPKPLHETSTAMMVLSASAWGETAREDENLQNDIYYNFGSVFFEHPDRLFYDQEKHGWPSFIPKGDAHPIVF